MQKLLICGIFLCFCIGTSNVRWKRRRIKRTTPPVTYDEFGFPKYLGSSLAGSTPRDGIPRPDSRRFGLPVRGPAPVGSQGNYCSCPCPPGRPPYPAPPPSYPAPPPSYPAPPPSYPAPAPSYPAPAPSYPAPAPSYAAPAPSYPAPAPRPSYPAPAPRPPPPRYGPNHPFYPQPAPRPPSGPYQPLPQPEPPSRGYGRKGVGPSPPPIYIEVPPLIFGPALPSYVAQNQAP